MLIHTKLLIMIITSCDVHRTLIHTQITGRHAKVGGVQMKELDQERTIVKLQEEVDVLHSVL